MPVLTVFLESNRHDVGVENQVRLTQDSYFELKRLKHSVPICMPTVLGDRWVPCLPTEGVSDQNSSLDTWRTMSVFDLITGSGVGLGQQSFSLTFKTSYFNLHLFTLMISFIWLSLAHAQIGMWEWDNNLHVGVDFVDMDPLIYSRSALRYNCSSYIW